MIISPDRLGWIPPQDRTDEQHEAHEAAMASMPKFAIAGDTSDPPVGTKVMLTDYWKHPAVVAQLGFAYPGIHQVTGSCVGAGGGNAIFTCQVVENILKGTPEAIILPLWLLTYGKSRQLGGMRGKGEGSLGSSFAQAARECGTIDANGQGMPKYVTSNGLIWGTTEKEANSTELQWSDGASIDSKYLEESKTHLIKTTSSLSSAKEVRDAILNGYPVTRAFMYFCNPGSDEIKGSGDNAVLMGKYDGRGGHQESWDGVWNHPDFGWLYHEMNQWGTRVYKVDPAGTPPGGVWQLEKDVDKMCQQRDAEIFAFSGFQGYPGRNLIEFYPKS